MERRPAGWILAALLAALCTGGCGGAQQHPDVSPWPPGDASYDFDNPDLHVELPDALEEISGLAVMDDGMLAAVQDEDGILYVIDPRTGEIVDERSFGPPADYEALSFAAGRLLVLESTGTLHAFDAWSAPQFTGRQIDLDLPRRCDAEGMRYDPLEERILVACKEYPGPGLRMQKAVYAFDLEGRPLGGGPAFVLDSRAFSISVEDHPVNEAVRSVLSERVDLSGFKPSDLAVHPITGELFVLSSVREAVLSVRRDGTVSGVWKLPDAMLDQPEGMDFLPNGDLFISSEAADRPRATLLRFNYRSPQTSATE